MTRAVIDSTVLVSALLRHTPGGASYELLRYASIGAFELFLSPDILEETARVLLTSQRLRHRYAFSDADVIEYCKNLATIATILTDPPAIEPLVRDPNDDMVVACAVAAKADYLVSRDKDLLSLSEHAGVKMIAPEDFLQIARSSV